MRYTEIELKVFWGSILAEVKDLLDQKKQKYI